MQRSRSRRDNADIWPGFVDALSTLLMVIMFLLVVFMLGQFLLSRALETRDEDLSNLESNLALFENQLTQEQEAKRALQIEMAELTENIADLRAERDQLTMERQAAINEVDDLSGALTQALERASQLEIDLAERSTDATREAELAAQLAAELAETRTTFAADRDTIEAQLAELTQLRLEIGVLTETRDRIDADLLGIQAELQASLAELEASRAEQARLEAALSDESQGRQTATSQVDLLSRQIATLSGQLMSLEGSLISKQGEIDQQNLVIADLGVKLNEALADKVEELSQFRSDFFGKLRNVLGARDDVQIVGDRFVFQSEVLFGSGQAEIGSAGRGQLAQMAQIFTDLSAEIPDELPWVVQVDGHTDKRPISGNGRFPSNWELSTARAISVARFLIAQGLPAERVAARGFAEFQPIDDGNSEAALRRNRRIEIKLTTR